MAMNIPFGKYKERSIEQVSLTDYPYIAYIREKFDLSISLEAKIDEVIHRLNNFIPLVNCEVCTSPAEKISTAYDLEGNLNIPNSYFYCNKQECLDSINRERIIKNPLEYNSILKFKPYPGYLREEMHKLLLKTIGFKEGERLTKKRADKLIYSLELRVPLKQTNLFDKPKKPKQLGLF